ncbi:hypothetical protein DFH09DRAFT_1091851 [Mycena vulgaris]|nr:hypothetical protein DFH09DRAFT_1091851 [Mycena vulgaris]
MNQIHDPKRLQFTPAVPETALKAHHVPSGMLPLKSLLTMTPEPTSLPNDVSYSGLSSGTSGPAKISATQFIAGPSRAQDTDVVVAASKPPVASQPAILKELSRRRVDEAIAVSQPAAKRPRHGRTCRKCYVETCMGKGKVEYCRNKCRDCGKFECKGRNPKFPTKKCNEAPW